VHVRGTHLMCQVQGSASSADPANRSLLVTFPGSFP
jgi:hypothetical protein